LANPIEQPAGTPEERSALRQRVATVLWNDLWLTRRARWINGSIVALILLNVMAVIAESDNRLAIPYATLFRRFELLSVVVFTLEYLMRIWSCPDGIRYGHLGAWQSRWRFIFSFNGLIDFFAIAPFFLSLLLPVDLRFLRILRLLRILKLTTYSDTIGVFARVLKREGRALAAASLAMVSLVLFAACLMYMLENPAQPEAFSSIAQAIWWAAVTLTTVGYGDITPVTFGGKMLGIVIMVLGVGTVALPAAMLAARFGDEIQAQRDELEAKVAESLDDGVLDPAERAAVEKLGAELGLPAAHVDKMIELQKQLHVDAGQCPHCGKKL